jgi:predicted TIM-barrel fold metal-dependent hydrolase
MVKKSLIAILCCGAVGVGLGAQRGGRGQNIQPGQECPPGTTETRPNSCQAPSEPAPSILDYRPRSTLVTVEHKVPKAKFPVIDIHSHQPAPISAQQLATVVKSMDPLNLQILVNASGATGERLKQSIAAIAATPYKNRMVMFTNISFREPVGPGFGQRVAQQIEADVKAGALGVGEIQKDFGLRARKADGSRLRIDDPELDPIWEACARLNVPVLIHTADPQEFFQPITYQNERWLELALYPDRRYPQNQFPSFEEISAERDALFRRHPKTTFIMAHLGWHANDLARLGRMFDSMPNVYGEVGAVLYDLGRQPRTAHDFLVKYQDRVLFGKDSYQPDEFPYYWRVFETNDEYFDYYRDYHAFWKLYGVGLPDAVLRKLYFQNALKLIPGMPKAGFPS